MPVLHDLMELQLHGSNESTFAAILAGSFSGSRVPVIGVPRFTAAQDVVASPQLLQHPTPRFAPVLGSKSKSKLAFSTQLKGTGTSAGDGVTALGASSLPHGQLLANAMTESLGAGTTVAASPAPTTTGFTCADASGIEVGQAVLVDVGSGVYEANVVLTKSVDALTFQRAFSAAPAASAVVYASATYYPHARNYTQQTLQFEALGLEGASSEGLWQIAGCGGTFKLANLNPGELPQIDWEWMVANWALDTGSQSLGAQPDAGAPPVPGFESTLYVQDMGTTTRNVVHAQSIAIDPGLTLLPLGSVSGTQGVQGWRAGQYAPTVELQLNDWDADWLTDFTARNDLYLHYQIGATPGNTILIDLQSVYLDAVPERVAVNSMAGAKVNGGARGGISSDTILVPGIRIHRL